MIRYRCSLAVLGWMVSSALVWAQKGPTAAPVVGDAIDVRVVNVEVVVTDRRGNRVTGLKPGDFRLKVDGKAIPVEYFTEVRDGRAAVPAADAGAPVPGIEAGETIGTQYLVFIDDFFSIGAPRDVVLASLKKELGRLGPADRMSIVDWDGSRLVRLADWSASRQELAAALDRAQARPARGLEQRVALNFLREEQRDSHLYEARLSTGADDQLDRILGSNPGLSMVEIGYGQVLAAQIEGASSAVISAMRGSAPPAGRKVLLLLSGGWPFSLQDYVQLGRTAFTRELPESLPYLQELADTANLLGYTLYPVDVPGITSTVASAAFNPMDGHPSQVFGQDYGNPADNPRPTVLTPVFGSDSNLEGTLLYLARETGGKAMLNGNREVALSRTGDDTRSYYWLGFTPAWQRDNDSHKVEVEMLPRGLKARSRRGFLDLSRPAAVAMRIDSALLFGELPDGKPLGVHLGAPVKAKGKERGMTEIPLTLDIPASAVTLLPASDGQYRGQAELRIAALDDQGNQSAAPPLRIDVSSPQPPAEAGVVHYQTRIFLRGRTSQVVAALYDPVSGEVAAGRADLEEEP
jgi:VWFA-related protein